MEKEISITPIKPLILSLAMFKTKRNSFKRKINLKEMKARVLLFSPTYPIIAAAVLLLKCFNCYESVRLAPIRSLSAEILIRF